MEDRMLRIIAALGFAVGGALGIAGTMATSDSMRGLMWGIDGTGIVVAGAIATLLFHKNGQYEAAAGFLIFTIGESLLVGSASMELRASAPLFGGGVALWAAGLALIGLSTAFPLIVRLIGFVAAALFAIVALQIFSGADVTPLTSPLPFFGYPVLVATMIGWIWSLLRHENRNSEVESA